MFKKLIPIRTKCASINDWLLTNKMERMDANRMDLFQKSRTTFHMDRYDFASSYVKNKIILDVASGTGYGAARLRQKGKANLVYGIEIDTEAVKYSVDTYGNTNVHFLEGSILDIPFKDEMFDVVTSFETIEHIINEERQFSEIRRILRSDGYFILSTPNDWGEGDKSPFHIRSYNYYTLQESISPFFQVMAIFNQNSGTPKRKANHGQPRGIIEINKNNFQTAECFIVIAKK